MDPTYNSNDQKFIIKGFKTLTAQLELIKKKWRKEYLFELREMERKQQKYNQNSQNWEIVPFK